MAADEISIITRTPEEGTHAVLLKDTPHYAERSHVYTNGDLWVSYADGESESALVKGGARP